jgi:hypothetical protein
MCMGPTQNLCLAFLTPLERSYGSVAVGVITVGEVHGSAMVHVHFFTFTPLLRSAALELKNELAASSREMTEAFHEVLAWPSVRLNKRRRDGSRGSCGRASVRLGHWHTNGRARERTRARRFTKLELRA